MNLNIAVVGPAKVGKTLFCINFAEYLGSRSLCYTEQDIVGRKRGMVTPELARKTMVSPGFCCNGVVRSFAVNITGRRPHRLVLVDTASLKDQVPLPERERSKLLLTLQALLEADVVLYLVDLTGNDPAQLDFALETGRYLADFCNANSKVNLCIATKQDILNGKETVHRQFFAPNGKIHFISSLTGRGFPELRRILLGKQVSI